MRIHGRCPIVVCVQVRPVAGRSLIGRRRTKSQVEKSPVMVRDHGVSVPAAAALPVFDRWRGHSMTAFRVLHGEFDPGSGRTLAACLTHASGATNQGLLWGRAANG